MSKLLPWHASQWWELMQRKATDRLPHALLCSGPAGLGKRQFAEYFAQSLFCKAPTPEGSPCGICRDCRLFLAGNHPNYLRVEPTEEARSAMYAMPGYEEVDYGHFGVGSGAAVPLEEFDLGRYDR